jgi:hypothetical protein
MHRICTAMGLGVSIVALSAGPVWACPADRYPASEGWFLLNETFTFPAGYACDVEVTVYLKGHQRYLVDGEIPPPRAPQDGDVIRSESPDVRATVTNTVNGRSVTIKSTGTINGTVTNNGKDLSSVGHGANLYFGAGVEGLLYTKGTQRLTTTDFQDPATITLHFTKIKGKAVDLCRKVGASPVPGKNPPPPTTE